MIRSRSIGIRIAVLLVVVMGLSFGTANAYQNGTFNLRIEDPNGGTGGTGYGRVITDNNCLTASGCGTNFGFANNNGDQSLASAGAIYFSGPVGTFTVQISASSSTVNSDGTGGGVLTLSGRVSYTGTAPASIVITLEDSAYFPDPAAALVGTIAGYNYSTKQITSAGNLAAGGTINFQSWLNTANEDPYFGADTGPTTLNPTYNALMGNGGQTDPYAPATGTGPNPNTTQGTNTSIAADGGYEAFNGTGAQNGQFFNTNQFSFTGASIPVAFANSPGSCPTGETGCYSLYSQVTATFTGSGATDFSVMVSNPSSVPEPTSLLLLGSALLGFAILRKRII